MTTIILIIGLLLGGSNDYNETPDPNNPKEPTTKIFDLDIEG